MTIIACLGPMNKAHGSNLLICLSIFNYLVTYFAFDFKGIDDWVDVGLLFFTDFLSRALKIVAVEADELGLVRCVGCEWIEVGGHLPIRLAQINQIFALIAFAIEATVFSQKWWVMCYRWHLLKILLIIEHTALNATDLCNQVRHQLFYLPVLKDVFNFVKSLIHFFF